MSLVLKAFQGEEDRKYGEYLKATHKKFCPDLRVTIEHPITDIDYRYESEQKNDYMRGQLRMLTPTDSQDFIGYIGIDSVFTEEITIDRFVELGKVIMPYTSYESLYEMNMSESLKGGVRRNQEMTSEAMGEEVEYEFARRLPLVYPKEIFEKARAFIEETHGMEVGEYLSKRDMFNAYNFLGAYCYKYANDLFVWLNTDEMKIPELPIEANLKAKDFVIVL